MRGDMIMSYTEYIHPCRSRAEGCVCMAAKKDTYCPRCQEEIDYLNALDANTDKLWSWGGVILAATIAATLFAVSVAVKQCRPVGEAASSLSQVR